MKTKVQPRKAQKSSAKKMEKKATKKQVVFGTGKGWATLSDDFFDEMELVPTKKDL